MKKIYVLDGSGFLYRAWHAFRSMSNTQNDTVTMVYGFFRMIIKLLMEKPDNLIIVWDAHGKTVRHEKFEWYKANRPPMPDEFGQQIKQCKELAPRLGITTVEQLGYEADDIIYTIARQEGEKMRDRADHDCLIVYTGDKDIKQILEYPCVKIHDPMKDEVWTKDKFVREFEFEPRNIVDYLALLGDASDNLPGARGIGVKWASELIKKFGSIDTIYNSLDQVPERTRNLLIESKDTVINTRSLIELLEVPDFQCNIDMSYKPDIPLYKDIFIQELGFKSFEKLLDDLRKESYFTPQGGLFG